MLLCFKNHSETRRRQMLHIKGSRSAADLSKATCSRVNIVCSAQCSIYSKWEQCSIQVWTHRLTFLSIQEVWDNKADSSQDSCKKRAKKREKQVMDQYVSGLLIESVLWEQITGFRNSELMPGKLDLCRGDLVGLGPLWFTSNQLPKDSLFWSHLASGNAQEFS